MKFHENFLARTCAVALMAAGVFFAVSCEEEPIAPQTEEKTEEPAPKPEVTIAAGEQTETSVQFYLSAKEAEEIAYSFVQMTDELKAPSAEELIENGEIVEASEEPVAYLVEDLTPAVDYMVYAVASIEKDGKVYYSEVAGKKLSTSAIGNILSLGEVTKTGFSYNIDVPEGFVYYHAYIEGWYFDYMYQLAIMEEGAEFDENVFVFNLLAEFGMPGTSFQTVKWVAGQENEMRGDIAYIAPGKKYYVMAGLFDETSSEGWQGKAEYISFNTADPGVSDKTITCTVESLTYDSVTIRMEQDPTEVNFYFYNLYNQTSYDEFKAGHSENFERAMMDYVYEYGYPKSNTYTDKFTVEAGKSYMLCIYGVDYYGNEFYQELQIVAPMPEPEIKLSMVPYEREAEGYYSYNTLKVSCSFDYFGDDMDFGNYAYAFLTGVVPKATFDEFLVMTGLPQDYAVVEQEYAIMLYQYGMYNLNLYPLMYNEALYAQLADGNSYEWIIAEGVNPDTEYVFVQIAAYNDKWYCRIVSAKTDVKPEVEEASDAYKAYLGNWLLEGQMTSDWSTRASYVLTVEQLTANRSFNVYGWSANKVGEDFPFVMRFDSATGKMSIESPQILGDVVIDGKTYEVQFVGKIQGYGDDLEMVDTEGVAYTGNINGTRMQFFPSVLGYYEVSSMSYVYRDKQTNEFYKADEYDLVNFTVNKR